MFQNVMVTYEGSKEGVLEGFLDVRAWTTHWVMGNTEQGIYNLFKK